MTSSQGHKYYVVVEFADETEEGVTPEAIISSTWIMNPTENPVYCLWPGYFKSECDRIKATINHTRLIVEKCGQCRANILYTTDNYQKAVKKLDHLETQSFVSQTEDEIENDVVTSQRTKRIKRPNKIYEDYENINYDSDDDLIAKPPPVKKN
ncbi:uncharacterized protein LOC123005183 [Tribolium madens]|uniref:uncharacterized protein LOC123005183 n=1 Tax=Tribolium madens TaxID=41895 RepID=UPI001CF75937|nr:uncharacterized protein LOC123005183 [Tribolium madens]